MLLARHKALWTSDPDTAFHGVSLRQPGYCRFDYTRSPTWRFKINYTEIGSIGVTEGVTGPWSIEAEPDGVVRMLLTLAGNLEATLDGRRKASPRSLSFSPLDRHASKSSAAHAILTKLSRARLAAALESLDSDVSLEARVAALWYEATPQLEALERTFRFVLHQIANDAGMLDKDAFHLVHEELLYLYAAQALVGAAPEAAAPAGSAALNRCIEYIEDRLTCAITLSDVAAAAGLSVRSVQLLFQKQTGGTVSAHIRTRRLARVHRLLAMPSTRLSVTQAAFSCGFSHMGQFTMHYRDAFGETPSATLRAATRSH